MLGGDGMRKRTLLILIIILMCVVVAIGGALMFINSKSVLFQDKKRLPDKTPDDLKILVDVTENRMYLISKGNVIKSYSVSTGKYESPSPIGDWKIVSKDTWGDGFGGHWIGLNVPWGKYGIHGTNKPGSIGGAASHGCIRMFNDEVAELYRFVKYGTPVKIYGGPFGPFGMGFRPLSPGDRGSDVYEVQKKLKSAGYFKGYVDGIYGEEMRSAVLEYEKKNGLYQSNCIGHKFYSRLGIFLFE